MLLGMQETARQARPAAASAAGCPDRPVAWPIGSAHRPGHGGDCSRSRPCVAAHAQAEQVAAPAASQPQRRRGRAPLNVVITGGSKGVGQALAREFVRAGDNVVICSRDGDRVQSAVRDLCALAKDVGRGGTAAGTACNVAKPGDVAQFAQYAKGKLGTLDLWINNAGTNAYSYKLLAECTDADLISIVETNTLGVMLACKEAIGVMRGQPSGGHIFNMDGAGADGGATPRFAAYGATKRGLQQLSKSLQAELKMLGINNIGLHNLSPGMVTTELLMAGERGVQGGAPPGARLCVSRCEEVCHGADTPTARFFINCLAEEAADVARDLVPRIRRVPQESRSLTGGVQGQYIRFLTKPRAYSQVLARLLLGRRKNRFVSEDG